MSEVDQLRAEMREDRNIIQSLIIERFDKLDDRLLAVGANQSLMEGRVKVIEDRMSNFGKMIWGLVVTVVGSMFGWMKG